MAMLAFKLLRVRKDGSLGPLFINKTQRIPIGKVLKAEAYKTKGFAFRPGWHSCAGPKAPHLSKKGREWYLVEISGEITEHWRPESQGGLWFTSTKMKVLRHALV